MQDTAKTGVASRDLRWYALYLRSRYEKRVEQRLCECGFCAFLPLIEEVHDWSDRRRTVLEPLFRGYVFVKTDLRNRQAILETEGVVRFVGVGRTPSAIPEVQIEGVRIAAAQPAKIQREEPLMGGQRVKVVAGPFTGIEGVVSRRSGHLRVVLEVDMMAHSVSVAVHGESLVGL